MAGTKGHSGGARPNTGGARPGSGRKKLKEEYEVKYELQKHLFASYKNVKDDLDGKKPSGINTAHFIINKFVSNPTKLVGEDGQSIQFNFKIDLAGGYIPPMGAIITTPGTSYTRPPQIQSSSLAQTGKEDNNSPN